MTKAYEVYTEAVQEKGWKGLDFKMVSNHPDDWYLAIALIENHKGEYVTYLFNAERAGFNCGYYYRDLEDAQANFRERN